MAGVGKVENLATDALFRQGLGNAASAEKATSYIIRDQRAQNPLPVPGNCLLLKSL